MVVAVATVVLTAQPASASPSPTAASGLASPDVSAGPGTYHALTASRILDTRTTVGGHHGLVGANQTVTLSVAGHGNVPVGVAGAVVVNVTVADGSGGGFVTVYPTGVSRPSVSDVNYTGAKPTSNLVTVKLGSGGRIELFNGSLGTTNLIVDVEGYFTSGAAASPGAFAAVTPSRVLDTRTGNGATGPVAGNGGVTVQVTGRGGIPASGVGAVVINVTVTDPAQSGYVTVYPTGAPSRPTASNLNFVAAQTIPNLVVVPVGTGGKINLHNGSGGQVQLIGDVQGYFRSGTAAATGTFHALSPSRILDTRSGLGGSHRVAAGAELKLHVAGHGGVPATGVAAVVLNVTVVGPSTGGNITAYPTGVVKPTTSNLNYNAGQTKPNLVIVPIDSYGWVSLTNNSSGSTDEIADVAGYFLGTGTEPTVLGPHTWGPFTMGMTYAQAKVAYPQLPAAFPGCAGVDAGGAGLVFNPGSQLLSFIRPDHQVQTANGIHFGDTVNSIKSRFPGASVEPDEPSITLAATSTDHGENGVYYWIDVTGPRGVDDVPLGVDTVDSIGLGQNERCFD